MRSRFKVFLSVLCAMALMVMPMSSAWGDPSSGDMIATNQRNVAIKPGMHRIDKFTLDEDRYFTSLGNDSGKPTLTLNTSRLQQIAKDQLLPKWSRVAAGVFRDQAGQLVDLYGEQPDSAGNMSWEGFDSYFNMLQGNATYREEKWSCWDLGSALGQTYATHDGDPGWDQLIVTGVKKVNNLGEARTMMAQTLRDSEKTNAISTQEFLDVDEAGETRLDALDSDESTIGFANVVTSVNCKGSSADFDYVSFGIVLYDFEPVPVAAKGLEYQTGEVYESTNDKGGNTSTITNGQQQDILHSALLGESVTETTSTTLSGLASYKMSQNIGANIGWSETESSEDTEFWADDESMGASTSGWSETTSMGLNWGAAWEMAGALGAEVGHSTSKEVSKAVETTIALPAHTAATIDHSASTTTYTQNYQQPTILNYKVAFYAISGDFYSSSAFGGIGAINPERYDKQSLVIMLDTIDDSDTSYGCAATDDLYSRLVTNLDVVNYDTANGRTYSTHNTRGGWTKSEDIAWGIVKQIVRNYYNVNIDDVARTNYFYETLGKLNVDKDKTMSAVQEIYPLHDLVSVNAAKTNYVLYSNNTLDRDALALEGYNAYGVPFYGFDPAWGQWNRCDENGEILNDGYLLDDDPVELVDEDTLQPKAGTTGGTIYMTWLFSETAAPKTGDSPEGQDLDNSDIVTPIVTIQVINVGLDDPHVTAEGSYTGYYRTPINLNNVITYEITDADDKILEVQPKWESREPVSAGIKVNEGTGEVTFTKPGTYKVRPYVVNNDNRKVYSGWLTVVATEHDLVRYDAKEPTCDVDGWVEHYRSADSKQYFTDAEGKNEVSKYDILIDALGHDWGAWTTTKQPSADEPGEQQRVCNRDAEHEETRSLYLVSFHMNGHGAQPDAQAVAAGTSATVPPEPTAAGYAFDGWFTDAACTESYDFGATVESNQTLYAKWVVVKHTVAAMAVGDAYEDEEGEWKVDPVAHGSITIDGDATAVTEDDYTYYYMDVEYGTPVTLTVVPEEGYGLKEIAAIPVNPDGSMGEPFTPSKIGANTYSFTMPDADVAVLASFAQLTVQYDGNEPEGEASGVPEAETIAYGGTPTKLDITPELEGYEFRGWFTDADCTKPYMAGTALTEDTTFYAKWVEAEIPTYTVAYTLSWEPDPDDPEDTGVYEDRYEAEEGATAYDPTEDLYSLAGKDLRAAYELYTVEGATWFMDSDLTEPYDFTTPVTEDTHLYAKIVPREYVVTYYNGSEELGTQKVAYSKAIGEIAASITKPEREGYDFADEWVTEDGAPWSIAKNPVTADLKLLASFRVPTYSVSFDANGGEGYKSDSSVEAGTDYNLPAAATFTAPNDKCRFEAWEVTIGSGEAQTKNPGDPITVTDNTTVKAIWHDHEWGEWEETTPATIGAEGEETRVCAEDETHIEARIVAKVDPTPLNDAIKAAQDAEKGVKTSDKNGNDLANGTKYTTTAQKKALDDAIKAAQAVVENENSTQKQVDDAVAALKKATDAYKKAIKTAAIVALKSATAPNQAYTGKALKPAVTVKDANGKTVPASAYTVTYANNTMVGKANVTVAAKKNSGYTGSAKTTFQIKGWKRLWGNNALDTMAAIAKEYGKASVAVVATNADFKDSLGASALAGSYNAPMLTTATAKLSAQTKSELKRMGVKTVYLIGSTAEVSANTEKQIKALGITVKRVQATASKASSKSSSPSAAPALTTSVASSTPSVVSTQASTPAASTATLRAIECAKLVKGRSDTVIIATQRSFKDALAIAPYAYASKSPILYAENNKALAKETIAYIKSAGFKKAIIVGGPIALPASVEDQLKSAGIKAGSISRLAGSNQYKTARVIAEWETGLLANGTGGSGLYQYASIKFQPAVKFSANKLAVSRADNDEIGWKDALAGAALCGKNRAVLVLGDDVNSAHAEAFIKANKAKITYGYVFGGTKAIPANVMDKLVKASL